MSQHAVSPTTAAGLASLRSLSVRKLVRNLYGQTEAQCDVVRSSIEIAHWLNAPPPRGVCPAPRRSGSCSNVAKSESACARLPASPIYSELMVTEEFDGTSASQGPLSGVALSVSDALDVVGFQTRFGVPSQMLHRAPSEESAFVSWLRKRGAQFIGKLKCQSPVAWEEGATLSRAYPAYVAVDEGASHYAITSTVLGSPAVTASLHHDVIGFKPTSKSFDTRQYSDAQHPFANTGHVGIVAQTLDDVKYLWDVYTGAVQVASVVRSIEEAKERHERTARAAEELEALKKKARTGAFSLNSDDPLDVLQAERDALLSRMVRNNTQTPPLAMTIGFPGPWMPLLFGDTAYGSDERFESLLRDIMERAAKTRKRQSKVDAHVDIIPLPFLPTAGEVERVLSSHRLIAEYEVARAVDRQWLAPTAVSFAAPPLPSTPNDWDNESKVIGTWRGAAAPSSRSGLLEELPQEIVSAIFNGRRHKESEYLAALRLRDAVVKDLDDMFRDVDIVCCPILSEPHSDGNLRSVTSTIPFAFAGSPVVSVKVSDELSLQLVGEMGRDTGLLEDATSFLRFVGKGTPPRWWREKFLGEH